jgi:Trypsin
MLGMHDSRTQDGAKYNIANAVLHPKFINLTIYDDYDMALITTTNKIRFGQNVKPICLPTPVEEFSDQTGIVAGWGALKEGVSTFGMGLQEVRIKVKRNEDCKRDLQKIAAFNDESMICGYENHKDACQVV